MTSSNNIWWTPVLNSRPSVYEYRPSTNKYADASNVCFATAQQLYVTFFVLASHTLSSTFNKAPVCPSEWEYGFHACLDLAEEIQWQDCFTEFQRRVCWNDNTQSDRESAVEKSNICYFMLMYSMLLFRWSALCQCCNPNVLMCVSDCILSIVYDQFWDLSRPAAGQNPLKAQVQNCGISEKNINSGKVQYFGYLRKLKYRRLATRSAKLPF